MKWNPLHNYELTDIIYQKVQFPNRPKHTYMKKQTNKHTRQASMFPLSFMSSMFMSYSLSAISTAVLSLWLLLNTHITTFLGNNQISCWGVTATCVSTATPSSSSSWRLIIRPWWAVKQSWLWRIHCFINFFFLLLFFFVNLGWTGFLQKRISSGIKGNIFSRHKRIKVRDTKTWSFTEKMLCHRNFYADSYI